MLKIGSLFSGIGGLELGLEMAGLGETLWQVEQDPYCQSVLARHWPEAKRYGDITKVHGGGLAPVDLICGGFPCQDVSSAGKGAGLSGSRSGLWYEFARILDQHGPRLVVVENVASGATRWVDDVRRDLERLGYESLPIPISAADVGAPHLRARIFLVAYSHGRALRHEQQWGSWGRAGRVCDSGQSVPSHVSRAWGFEVPDASGLGWPQGLPATDGEHGAPSGRGSGEPARVHSGISGGANVADAPGARSLPAAFVGVHPIQESSGPWHGQPKRRDLGERSEVARRDNVIGDPDRDGESAIALDGEVARLRGLASYPSPWAFAPEFRGMDDGVSVRLDNPDQNRRRAFRNDPWRPKRIKALGNAVVPQCAEVVGQLIRLLFLEPSISS